MTMLDAIEAAEKISTATADLRRAQTARPSAFSNATIKAAERRLAMLLAVLVHFKGDPDFDATYRGGASMLKELQKGTKIK